MRTRFGGAVPHLVVRVLLTFPWAMVLACLLLVLTSSTFWPPVEAFTLGCTRTSFAAKKDKNAYLSTHHFSAIQPLSMARTSPDGDDDESPFLNLQLPAECPSEPQPKLIQKRWQTIRRKIGLALAVTAGTTPFLLFGWGSGAAHAASAPVMALPKAEGRDPATEALSVHERKMSAAKQKELSDMAAQARHIEATQGEAARVQFELDYKQQQQDTAAAKKAGLEQLKRDLLNQGICPFVDLEGQRQVILYTKGVDLGNVPGTPFHLERTWEQKTPAKSMLVKKAMHRRVIQAMVQDMNNRGIDPVDYFQKHQDQTDAILNRMTTGQAAQLVQLYEQNLELYGQITVPKEGEKSAKELLAEKQAAMSSGGSSRAEKAAAAAAKKAAKQLAREEAAKAKAERKAVQQKAKEEAARAKAEAKAAARKAKQEARQVIARKVENEASQEVASALVADSVDIGVDTEIEPNEGGDGGNEVETTKTDAARVTKISSSMLSIVGRQVAPGTAAAASLIVAGGGGYAIKVYRDRADAAEERRRREFMLLMGQDPDGARGSNGDTNGSSSSNSSRSSGSTSPMSSVLDATQTSKTGSTPSFDAIPAPPPPPPAPKKKGLGLKTVFGKKSKNNRESDIMVLVSPDAPNVQFTTTLAKMLTHGAPGRFPAVAALPGGRDNGEYIGEGGVYQLDAARDTLTAAQTNAGLTLEESAEIFANVVNCMLIEIVDLAATSLKEKNPKVTVDAINIVVDFINHAASLFKSFVDDSVRIKPVTYGGTLSRSKLEQMYSEYAGAATLFDMENVPEDFQSRVSLLQDVFEIPDKKAEGLAMRAMQKGLVEAMKDPKKMEEMQEMMQNMGGMEGMEDMAGLLGGGGLDGDGLPDIEQLKTMLRSLKDLKDSGSVTAADFEKVKRDFEASFGSSLDEVVKEASSGDEELTETDKELLNLMKAIME